MRFVLPVLLACLTTCGLLLADAMPVYAQSGDPKPVFFGPSSMSLSTFKHRCNFYSPRGNSDRVGLCGPGDQSAICDDFVTTLEPISPDRNACIINCDRQHKQLAPANIFNGCEDVLRNARSVCKRFCRINYPY